MLSNSEKAYIQAAIDTVVSLSNSITLARNVDRFEYLLDNANAEVEARSQECSATFIDGKLVSRITLK